MAVLNSAHSHLKATVLSFQGRKGESSLEAFPSEVQHMEAGEKQKAQEAGYSYLNSRENTGRKRPNPWPQSQNHQDHQVEHQDKEAPKADTNDFGRTFQANI